MAPQLTYVQAAISRIQAEITSESETLTLNEFLAVLQGVKKFIDEDCVNLAEVIRQEEENKIYRFGQSEDEA